MGILTADSLCRDNRLEDVPPSHRSAHIAWGHREKPRDEALRADRWDDLEHALHAEINHGRWVVQCECGEAQLTHPDDPWFMCGTCANEHKGWSWRLVVFPENRAEIERLVDARIHDNLRNWKPGETVEGFVLENELLRSRGLLR